MHQHAELLLLMLAELRYVKPPTTRKTRKRRKKK